MTRGFRVGGVRVEPQLNAIYRMDGEVRVEPQVMNVLVFLAERESEVVEKDVLVRGVWGETVVGDDSLVRCISILRKAMHDNPKEHRVIQTVSKRGYRLQGPVRWNGDGAPHRGDVEDDLLGLEHLLASCSDHIYIYDRAGRYRSASAAAARAMGRSRADVEGRHWRELGMPAEIMVPFLDQVMSVFQSGRSRRGVVECSTLHGRRYYEYVLDPIRDGDREIPAVVAVVRDVTEHRCSTSCSDA